MNYIYMLFDVFLNIGRKYKENEKKYKDIVDKTEHIKFYYPGLKIMTPDLSSVEEGD